MENMWFICAFQPRNAPNAAMTHRDPSVKLSANLVGTIMMTGKNIMKESTKNTAPAPRKQKKKVSCCAEGMLRAIAQAGRGQDWVMCSR